MNKDTIKIQQDEINQLKAKHALNQATLLYVVDQSSNGVLIIDHKKTVLYSNNAALRLFNKNVTDLVGQPIKLSFNLESLSISKGPESKQPISNTINNHTISEVRVLKTEWQNEPCYLVSFCDITAMTEKEKMLEHITTHDALTNLPNRVHFEQQVDAALQYANDHQQQLALLYLNLDGFKIINDTLGHAAGDLMLQKVSGVLQQNVQSGDIISRLGSDEFTLILKSLTDANYAATISQSILSDLTNILDINGNEIYSSASIGISTSPDGGTQAIELIKNAYLAMNCAKTQGKNQYQFFSIDLNHQNEQNLQIINGLRHAIRNNELLLHYQPIIDLKKTTCCGFEALLRWQHPVLGLVAPAQFLLYAEEMSLMASIGQWVIQQALDDYNSLNFESLLFLTINMSANELLSAEAEEHIISCMKERGIATKNLVVELTETAIIRDPEFTIKKFKRLSEIGIKIAIDDYGIGYSSLSLLKRLPITIMKIDKSFIEDINKDPNDLIIVKSSIQLAHNLGLKVVAEGVETEEQLIFLKQHGCDYAQGYYFSKALEINQLSIYIDKLNAP